MIGESPDEAVTRKAIITIARRVVRNELVNAAETTLDWGDYPEIGEHDWERILGAVIDIADGTMPGMVEYQDAYSHLAARARDA